MYQAHFALREEPFGVSPDHRFFLPTEQHREALATLYCAVHERRGFALLVGNPGLGKTTVLVKLLQILEDKARTVYLPHACFDRSSVLKSILSALGIETMGSAAEDFQRLRDFLIGVRAAGKTCVVVFDEAHKLDSDTLEAIRILSNAETHSEKLIQIVLSGQPRLAETLQRPEFEQLRQRFSVVARLHPLRFDEVGGYMAHRLKAAGAEETLFAPEAIETIASASAGVPRNVNTLSSNSLTLAYALNHSQVGREEVEEAIRDLDLRQDVAVPNVVSPENAPEKTFLPGFRHGFPSAWRSYLAMVLAASLLLLLSWFTGTIITDCR